MQENDIIITEALQKELAEIESNIEAQKNAEMKGQQLDLSKIERAKESQFLDESVLKDAMLVETLGDSNFKSDEPQDFDDDIPTL